MITASRRDGVEMLVQKMHGPFVTAMRHVGRTGWQSEIRGPE